ncbi:MAG: response regulator [Planctomycetes bacterium]|nr:response regulator [Planctomycetota bacterium]
MNDLDASVLLVDDDEAILHSLVRTLRVTKLPVITMSSPVKALEWLGENTAAVILADYHMPELNGIEFLQAASSVSPNAIRIMLSGAADLGTALDALDKDLVERYISKPWDPDKLRKTVKDSYTRFMENGTDNRKVPG